MTRAWSERFTDEAVSAIAEALVREERLGESASADLLAVSLSAVDRGDHGFGARSPEPADAVARWTGSWGAY